jgi:hypothetical protein
VDKNKIGNWFLGSAIASGIADMYLAIRAVMSKEFIDFAFFALLFIVFAFNVTVYLMNKTK